MTSRERRLRTFITLLENFTDVIDKLNQVFQKDALQQSFKKFILDPKTGKIEERIIPSSSVPRIMEQFDDLVFSSEEAAKRFMTAQQKLRTSTIIADYKRKQGIASTAAGIASAGEANIVVNINGNVTENVQVKDAVREAMAEHDAEVNRKTINDLVGQEK